MQSMLNAVCRHVRNYFPAVVTKEGNFTIENGSINLVFVNDGEYILIEGSRRNDGIVKYSSAGMNLNDETFDGVISVRAIPQDFLDLVSEIETYMTGPGANHGGFTSESFAGYSYTKATNASGAPADVWTAFHERLNEFRRI